MVVLVTALPKAIVGRQYHTMRQDAGDETTKYQAGSPNTKFVRWFSAEIFAAFAPALSDASMRSNTR
jgi:hypothetical protein